MSNLLQIVKKIKSTISTIKMTDSLKKISSIKLSVYKDIEKKSKYYTIGIKKIFTEIFSTNHQFINEANKKLIPKDTKGTMWILIGTDIGMCSDFNKKILKNLSSKISPIDKLVVLGSKLFTLTSSNFKNEILWNFSSEINFKELENYSDKIVNKIIFNFLKSKNAKLKILFWNNKNKNIFSQINILPFDKNYTLNKRKIVVKNISYRFKFPDIFVSLFPKYLESIIINSIIKSKISEHLLRSDLMYTATKNANELLENYKISFNKLRQSLITQEIIEIISASKSKK